MGSTRALAAAMSLAVVLIFSACSREQRDWRTAQAADTIEAYGRFLERHPESQLAVQARARVEQLGEQRDWERAVATDTEAAYRRFLALHPSGKWSQEARIRIESFALAASSPLPPEPAGKDAPAPARTTGTAASGTPVAGAGAPSRSEASPAPVPAPRRERATAPAPSTTASRAEPAMTAPRRTPPPPASPPSPADRGSPSFGVQLGAFSTAAAAREQWQRLRARFPRELGQLTPQVTPANTTAGRVFRLQADVAGEAQARSICLQLKKHSEGCVVVLPAAR